MSAENNELNRVLSNPENFIVSDSLSERLGVIEENKKLESLPPTLKIFLSDDKCFKFNITSWAISNRDEYIKINCKPFLGRSSSNFQSIGLGEEISEFLIEGLSEKNIRYQDKYKYELEVNVEHKTLSLTIPKIGDVS